MSSLNPLRTFYVSPITFLWLATAILLLAAVLRLVALQDVPPGLAQDEVLDADIAALIRQGQHAFFFREGYGHEPLYHYWTVPFAPLLGDNVLAIRLPAVFLGLFLVAAVLRWARRDFGPIVAVVAGLGLAISWWPIIFSRIGIRPILEPLLLVGMALYWPRHPWLAGLFLGLSLYSYTAARVVFLIPLLLIPYLLIRQRRSRTEQPSARLRGTILMLLVAALIYLPMGLTLWADPSLQQRVEQLGGPLEALRQGDLEPVWLATKATLGVFSFTGDPRWTYTLPDRPLFDPLTSLLFYGGLLLAVVRWRQPRYMLLLIWLGVTLLPSALTPQAPSTVRLVGAMPVVYLLPGLAAGWLWRVVQAANGRLQVASDKLQVTSNKLQVTSNMLHVSRLALYGLLVLLLAINLGRTVRDGFQRWPAALETREKYQTVLMDIGRYWRAHQTRHWVVTEGFFEPIDGDSLRRNLGFDPGVRWVQTGAEVAGAIVFPGGATGQAGRLYVPEFASPAPELLAMAGISPQPLYRSDGRPSFAVYALPARPPTTLITPPITFGEQVTLLGYELHQPEGDRPLQLYTYWRVETSPPWDLKAFVHLLADDVAPVTQHDGLDAATATLQPGDRWLQRHLLPLPAPFPEGPFSLAVGLYTSGNGQRLPCEPCPGIDHVILTSRLLFDGK